MTHWELAACVEGYNQAHGGEQEIEPPTDREFDRLLSGGA